MDLLPSSEESSLSPTCSRHKVVRCNPREKRWKTWSQKLLIRSWENKFQDFYEQGERKTLGAVVTTPEIAQVMAQKIQFNTFGRNPVCSSGGLAVLKVMDKEKRQMHCADVGSH